MQGISYRDIGECVRVGMFHGEREITKVGPAPIVIRAPALTERIMLATEFVYIFQHYEALHGRAAALAHPVVQAARARYRRACG